MSATFPQYESHVKTEFGYTPFFWETPKPNRRTTGGECREYRTDENGRIVYYIPPQVENIVKIHISFSSDVVGQHRIPSQTLEAFFSPSHSYLSIDAHELPEQLPCSGDVTVKLLSTEQGPVPAMVYKILSRGKIIKEGNIDTDTLTFPMLPKMGPEFKLLVYYIKESGEVVSDSRVFEVDKCLPNNVQVSWDQKTVKPGDSASFTVRASPNSVCGISAVDKSTELLGTSNQITLDTVFSKLQQFIIDSYEHPRQKAGFLVLSNLALETRPCYKSKVSRRGPPRPPGPPGPPGVSPQVEMQTAPPPQEDQLRDFFPEAFLFSLETLESFPVNFLSLGEVNITVTARAQDGYCDEGNTIAPGSDTVIRPIVVKPEGFPQEVTHSRFICLDEGDDHHTETVNLPVPEGLVPDSQRAYFSVIGDLLGQTFQVGRHTRR
ncbi:Ovostatin [Amphibalanus amphitrite]|uniref:Ovostatin n=1 Tax=Amphibalanus amphitrite TaxID=1232801 RepID=A0A6A4UZP3_AMPAM|nr:Ovostatin [Amphibalanus amphitrite]